MESYSDRCVILDTNMILSIFEHSIDLKGNVTALVGKCRVVVPSTVIDELHTLSESREGKKKKDIQSAINYVKKNFEIVEGKGSTDDSLVELAKKLNGVIATNDRKLRKRLRAELLPVIFLREKKKLVLEGLS